MKPVHDIICVISHVGFFSYFMHFFKATTKIKRVLQITPKPLFHYMQAMIFLTSLTHKIFHVLKLNFISFRKQYHNIMSVILSVRTISHQATADAENILSPRYWSLHACLSFPMFCAYSERDSKHLLIFKQYHLRYFRKQLPT